MTIDEFKLFRKLIYDECGIDFQLDKVSLLETRIRKRMSECGINGYYQYYQHLKHGMAGARELIILMDLLTINETTFFRNKPQFELLSTVVLPELIAAKKREGKNRLRIWSAGCSSGQEPYSIAITVLEMLPFPDLWEVKILASDLSLRMLEIAQAGCYSAQQLRGLDEERLSAYFTYVDGEYQLKNRIRKMVTYDYHNLKHDNGLRDFDIIFCRNVMIYFDQAECARLVERFANSLVRGGYIFIGHAETLKGLSKRFKMIHQDKGIAYRKEE
jgi:chemotaxis protein methyltransferase CheR